MKKRLVIMSLLGCFLILVTAACSVTGDGQSAYLPSSSTGFSGSDNPHANTSVSVSAMFRSYDSIDALSHAATDVIRGEVIGVRVGMENTRISRKDVIANFARELGRNPTEEEMRSRFTDYKGDGEWHGPDAEPLYSVMTMHSIRVLEVFQGTYQIGDVFEVAQHGGAYGNSVVSFRQAPLEVGQDLVMFIHSWSFIGRPNVMLNPRQGVYFSPAATDGDRILSIDTELENLLESHNELNITINDLLQLSSQHEFALTRSGEWQPTFLPPAEPQVRPIPERALPNYTPWPDTTTMPRHTGDSSDFDSAWAWPNSSTWPGWTTMPYSSPDLSVFPSESHPPVTPTPEP